MQDATANVLFGKTRQAVLSALFEDPGRGFYLRELQRKSGLSTGALQHELGRLGSAELIVRERDGNRVNYRPNTAHPVFEDLRRLVLKTCGLPMTVRRALSGLADLDFAAIYGSFAKGASHARSDVDLLVVGQRTLGEVLEALAPVEEQTGREIGVRLYSRGEFAKKKRTDAFLRGVLSGPLIPILGAADDA